MLNKKHIGLNLERITSYQKHKCLETIKQGVKAWNKWREKDTFEFHDLSKVNLRNAILRNANLRNISLIEADLRHADLKSADLSGSNLCNANLSNADLRNAHLYRADFSKANLSNADLRNAKILETNLLYANLSNANLKKAFLADSNLVGADLSNVDLTDACLRYSNLSFANLSYANLSNVEFDRAILNNTDFSRASLINCSIYGIASWDVKLDKTIQKDLRIVPTTELVLIVDNLEVAQFIYLLLHNEKIRHIIDTITTKVVLILGRFTSKRKAILEAIRKELRKYDYVPVLFDFEKPVSKDTQETITTLAHLAKFVIADITSPKSIPQELVSIVENLPSLPVQPLLMSGKRPWGMYDHIKRYPWVLPIHRYRDIDDLIISLREKIIALIESKVLEVRNKQ